MSQHGGESTVRAPMPAVPAASASGWRWLPLAAAVVVLDQLTKLLVAERFELYERVQILPVFDLTLRYNTGAAFSFLADAAGWQRWFFVALALAIAAGIAWWLRRLHARAQALLASALALVLGGAIGNVIDRLRLGHVVDFILVYWGQSEFPAFNIADSAITIGAGLLLLDAWREGRTSRNTGERR